MSEPRWLAAGTLSDGGERRHDLVKFNAYGVGVKVVAVNDIIDIQ